MMLCYLLKGNSHSGKAAHIGGLVQNRCNSIANALELYFSCTNPSAYWNRYEWSQPGTNHNKTQQSANCEYNSWDVLYIDGLVQERRNSSAIAMELRLSCTNPSILCIESLLIIFHNPDCIFLVIDFPTSNIWCWITLKKLNSLDEFHAWWSLCIHCQSLGMNIWLVGWFLISEMLMRL